MSIKGGELTAKRLSFDMGFPNAVANLKTMFTARGNFFTVPPYDERIDIDCDGQYIRFSRHDGSELFYEDAKYILSKVLLFSAITLEKAQELLKAAQELLSCVSTLLFPDPKHVVLELAVYENWARFDFYGRPYKDMGEKIRSDITSYFPADIKITANTSNELIFRTEDGSRLLFAHAMLKKMGAVLVSYGVLPPELQQRFVLSVGQFSLMQAVRMYLHHTLHAVKDAETIGGSIYMTYASDQAMRVLKQLGEHGDLESLSDNDATFLLHVLMFVPSEYKAFEGVKELRPFMELFIKIYAPEIRVLHDLRLRELGGKDGQGQVGMDEGEVIEGSTSKTIERDEEFRRLAERYQKRLGE